MGFELDFEVCKDLCYILNKARIERLKEVEKE